jgi:TRAP-type mannitol/chloroaromatic compound transport system permease large subunit
LFYLKAAAPPEIGLKHIYRGVIPFIILQVLVLMILILWPGLSTWLPEQMSQWHR